MGRSCQRGQAEWNIGSVGLVWWCVVQTGGGVAESVLSARSISLERGSWMESYHFEKDGVNRNLPTGLLIEPLL